MSYCLPTHLQLRVLGEKVLETQTDAFVNLTQTFLLCISKNHALSVVYEKVFAY